MDNRLNMLFNQELDNESQYINSHPFSSINMSLVGEVRYIAPIWPWNAPRFKVWLPVRAAACQIRWGVRDMITSCANHTLESHSELM